MDDEDVLEDLDWKARQRDRRERLREVADRHGDTLWEDDTAHRGGFPGEWLDWWSWGNPW